MVNLIVAHWSAQCLNRLRVFWRGKGKIWHSSGRWNLRPPYSFANFTIAYIVLLFSLTGCETSRETPAWQTVAKGDLNAVRQLSTTDLNVRHTSGATPLFHAVSHENIPMVRLLLEKGVEVNVRGVGGHTVLHVAAGKGSADLVSILLDYKADQNMTCEEGNHTPLWRAAYNGNTPAVVTLLQRGADPKIADQDGKTPYMVAKARGNTQIAQLLLDSIKLHRDGNRP